MILVLFIVFEVLASTCKLDWVLNTNFLQYLSVTFQSNVSNLWLVITKNKNTLFLAEALQIGALQLNIHFREIPATVHECPSVCCGVCHSESSPETFELQEMLEPKIRISNWSLLIWLSGGCSDWFVACFHQWPLLLLSFFISTSLNI